MPISAQSSRPVVWGRAERNINGKGKIRSQRIGCGRSARRTDLLLADQRHRNFSRRTFPQQLCRADDRRASGAVVERGGGNPIPEQRGEGTVEGDAVAVVELSARRLRAHADIDHQPVGFGRDGFPVRKVRRGGEDDPGQRFPALAGRMDGDPRP